MGNLDPDGGVPLELLRTEDARFTSLFGGKGAGLLFGNIGVVEPAWEKATEPFDCDTAADPGRDTDV